MAKFFLLFVVVGLLHLVVMSEAATKMSCDEQMVEQQRLNHCLMYLDSGSGIMPQGSTWGPTLEQHLDLCCMQLRNINESCRCEALNAMMSIQRWVRGMAENLPEKCEFEPGM
ncbi:hypothetical protein LXL04_037497 [Taraxacum kok-saghyz]